MQGTGPAEVELAKVEQRVRPCDKLVAESGADGNALAALGAAAAEHGGSALGLHAGPKAVGLDPLAAVGLKCALRHGNALLILLWKSAPRRQVLSITHTRFGIQPGSWDNPEEPSKILFHPALFHLFRWV